MIRCLVFLLSVSLAIGQPLWAGASNESKQLRVTGTQVNVRSEPSLKARVVYKVKEGDILQSLGQSGQWYKIADSKGRQGYIYSSLVTPITVTKTATTAKPAETRAVEPTTRAETTRRGPSKKTLLIGGGIAAVGIGALLLLSGGEDAAKKDSDDDGFTPEQGDCDDTNADINPNGSVTAVATSNVAGQSVSCTANTTWKVDVVNNSCNEVTITGMRVNQTVLEGDGCSSGISQLTPSQSVVAAGTTVTVYDQSVTAGCCVNAGCSGFCRFNRVYVVVSSAGDLRAAPLQFQVNYGPECPICP
jgi:uncharacterized protein YgiM (DUF1202 family)